MPIISQIKSETYRSLPKACALDPEHQMTDEENLGNPGKIYEAGRGQGRELWQFWK